MRIERADRRISPEMAWPSVGSACPNPSGLLLLAPLRGLFPLHYGPQALNLGEGSGHGAVRRGVCDCWTPSWPWCADTEVPLELPQLLSPSAVENVVGLECCQSLPLRIYNNNRRVSLQSTMYGVR